MTINGTLHTISETEASSSNTPGASDISISNTPEQSSGLGDDGNTVLWSDLDNFTKGYVTCAYWLADPCPGSGEYWFDTELWEELDYQSQLGMIRDCLKFQLDNNHLLQVAYALPFYNRRVADYHPHECAGHDFYLSRNGHGTGFRDRGREDVWDALDKAAHEFGEGELYYWPDTPGCKHFEKTGECTSDCDHGGTYSL